jgi:hypothetical protein
MNSSVWLVEFWLVEFWLVEFRLVEPAALPTASLVLKGLFEAGAAANLIHPQRRREAPGRQVRQYFAPARRDGPRPVPPASLPWRFGSTPTIHQGIV